MGGLKSIFALFSACSELMARAGLPAELADKLTTFSLALLVVFVVTSVAGIALKLTLVVRERRHPNPVGAVIGRISVALGSIIGIPVIAVIVVGLLTNYRLLLSFYTPWSQASELDMILNIGGIVVILMMAILLFSFVAYLIHETQKLIERFKFWGIFEMLNACLYGFMFVIFAATLLLSVTGFVQVNHVPCTACFIFCTVLYIVNEVSVQFDRHIRARRGNKYAIGYLEVVGDRPEGEPGGPADGSTKKLPIISLAKDEYVSSKKPEPAVEEPKEPETKPEEKSLVETLKDAHKEAVVPDSDKKEEPAAEHTESGQEKASEESEEKSE